jgi:hypothetical protein
MIKGEKGIDADSAMLGRTMFHSGYMPLITTYAKRYHLDAKELLKEVSDVEKVTVTEEIVEQVAKTLKPVKDLTSWPRFNFAIAEYHAECPPEDVQAMADRIAEEMLTLAKKTCKKTIFTIARSRNPEKKLTTFPFIRENESFIVGNSEVVSEKDAEQIIRKIDGLCDFVLLDFPLYRRLSARIPPMQSQVCAYDDAAAQVNSLVKTITALASENNYSVQVLGNNDLTKRLNLELELAGNTITSDSAAADFLIGVTPYQESIDEKVIKELRKSAIVIDAGPGTLTKKAVALGLRKGLNMYRLDMRAGLFGEIETVLKTQVLMKQVRGSKRVCGIGIVAGGVIGQHGDIVLDSMTAPRRVIGIADGQGGLLKIEEHKKFGAELKKIKSYISEQIYL